MKLKKIEKSFGVLVANPGRTLRAQVKQRLYGYGWQQRRRDWLAENPICAMCGNLASVLDHVVPHGGDVALFWDETNWQPLCKPCHDGEKQRQEAAERIA